LSQGEKRGKEHGHGKRENHHVRGVVDVVFDHQKGWSFLVDELIYVLHQIHHQKDKPESYQAEDQGGAELANQIFI
jgi:hypothetical protein